MSGDGVNIPLHRIYEQVQETDRKVDKLTIAVGEMVAVNKRLDAHQVLLAQHDERIDVLEQHKAVVDSRQRAPWWVVVSVVCGSLTAAGALAALLGVLYQVGRALSGEGAE